MKQISILGCGWLGSPLAKSLLEKGFSVEFGARALRRTVEKELLDRIAGFMLAKKSTKKIKKLETGCCLGSHLFYLFVKYLLGRFLCLREKVERL